jgi:hypothetical protein
VGKPSEVNPAENLREKVELSSEEFQIVGYREEN